MRTSAWFWAVLGATGCNVVFGLHSTKLLLDDDVDGVDNGDDNCPAIANPDQEDADLDDIGDACDSCPVVPNAGREQTADADNDGVPNACDPHATNKGDCLVLFDTFSDPATFSASWQVYATADGSTATPTAGCVSLAVAGMTSMIEVVASDLGGRPLADFYSVQAIAKGGSSGVGAAIAATSNALPDFSGYRCELQHTGIGDYGVAAYVYPQAITANRVVGDHIDSRILLRLAVFPSSPSIDCRIDFGGLVGTSAAKKVALLGAGAPGLVVTGDSTELHAIALYSFDSAGTTCPAPIIR